MTRRVKYLTAYRYQGGQWVRYTREVPRQPLNWDWLLMWLCLALSAVTFVVAWFL